MGACRARQLASVEILLSDKRLNVNLGSAFTPLYLVSRLGYADIAALLIAHPNIEVNTDKLGCVCKKQVPITFISYTRNVRFQYRLLLKQVKIPSLFHWLATQTFKSPITS